MMNFKQYEQTIAEVITLARKLSDLSQKELASRLNITQSTLSRWETGSSLPSVIEWMKFTTLLKIPLDAPYYGGIDLLTSVSTNNDFPRVDIPQNYTLLPCIKIRFLKPLLHYLKQSQGNNFQTLLAALALKKYSLALFDAQVNLFLLAILLRQLDYNQSHILNDVTEMVKRPEVHGRLVEYYRCANNQAQLLEIYFKESAKYQSFFIPQITKLNNNSIELLIKVNTQLRGTYNNLNPTALNAIESYHDAFLCKLSLFENRTNKEITIQKSNNILTSNQHEATYKIITYG